MNREIEVKSANNIYVSLQMKMIRADHHMKGKEKEDFEKEIIAPEGKLKYILLNELKTLLDDDSITCYQDLIDIVGSL